MTRLNLKPPPAQPPGRKRAKKRARDHPTPGGGWKKDLWKYLATLALGLVAGLQLSSIRYLSEETRLEDEKEAQMMGPPDDGYYSNGTEVFLEAAKSLHLVTDKVTTHTYQLMYGQYLLPYYKKQPGMKLLEIGFGCDADYALAGASVALWKKLFPEAELWEADSDAACLEHHKDKVLQGVGTLVGDQSDPKVLDRWVETSGGNFDVVIDDGGNTNCQIWVSVHKLWPQLKSGGLYFLEDLHRARANPEKYQQSTQECDGSKLSVPEKLRETIDTLVHDSERNATTVAFVYCQTEACVIGKA